MDARSQTAGLTLVGFTGSGARLACSIHRTWAAAARRHLALLALLERSESCGEDYRCSFSTLQRAAQRTQSRHVDGVDAEVIAISRHEVAGGHSAFNTCHRPQASCLRWTQARSAPAQWKPREHATDLAPTIRGLLTRLRVQVFAPNIRHERARAWA